MNTKSKCQSCKRLRHWVCACLCVRACVWPVKVCTKRDIGTSTLSQRHDTQHMKSSSRSERNKKKTLLFFWCALENQFSKHQNRRIQIKTNRSLNKTGEIRKLIYLNWIFLVSTYLHGARLNVRERFFVCEVYLRPPLLLSTLFCCW